MSSTLLVVSIVAALVFAAVGVQVSARQLQRFPFDTRRPGALLDTTRDRTWVVRPVELEQLTSVVTESLSSEPVARSKLWPLLDELGADAPGNVPSQSDAPGRPQAARGARSRRGDRRLDERLDELERAWRINEPTD